MSRRLAKLALIPVALLVCAPVAAQAQPARPDTPSAARVDLAKPLLQADRDYYLNNVAPRVESPSSPDRQLDSKGQVKAGKTNERSIFTRGGTTGFPPAAKQLARREALVTAKGISPRKTARESGQQSVQVGKLLTLLVEFNPNANDDFSGWERPNTDPNVPGECVTEPPGTLLNGPLHNELPDPATLGRGTDDNTVWIPDFTPRYYKKLIYPKEGVTQNTKVRVAVRPGRKGGRRR